MSQTSTPRRYFDTLALLLAWTPLHDNTHAGVVGGDFYRWNADGGWAREPAGAEVDTVAGEAAAASDLATLAQDAADNANAAAAAATAAAAAATAAAASAQGTADAAKLAVDEALALILIFANPATSSGPVIF